MYIFSLVHASTCTLPENLEKVHCAFINNIHVHVYNMQLLKYQYSEVAYVHVLEVLADLLKKTTNCNKDFNCCYMFIAKWVQIL